MPHVSIINLCGKIPPYSKNTKPKCISYPDTIPITFKLFNYKATLSDIDVNTFMPDHPVHS